MSNVKALKDSVNSILNCQSSNLSPKQDPLGIKTLGYTQDEFWNKYDEFVEKYNLYSPGEIFPKRKGP